MDGVLAGAAGLTLLALGQAKRVGKLAVRAVLAVVALLVYRKFSPFAELAASHIRFSEPCAVMPRGAEVAGYSPFAGLIFSPIAHMAVSFIRQAFLVAVLSRATFDA